MSTMPKPTIAYLVNQYPKGSHTFIRREIRALEELGHRIERISVRRPREALQDPADHEEAARTTTILDGGVVGLATAFVGCLVTRPARLLAAFRLAMRAGTRSERGLLMHLIYLAEACVLLRLTRASGAAHVHAHFGTNATTVAMLCGELGGPPFSFTVHGPEEFDKAPLLALGHKIARARFVAAVSSFGRSQLMRQCGPAAWTKIAVVPCGLDQRDLDGEVAHGGVPASPELVCIGRFNEQKGQLVLVRAAGELRRRGVSFHLTFVGDGELRGMIEEAIAQEGVGDSITLAGWQDETQVRNALIRSRALVLPSFAEGLPVVIMEALAMGRPVVSTYVAGIPELVQTGISGWLVPAGSVAALADAVAEVLATAPEQLTAMGGRGRTAVRARHDVRRSALQLSGLFAGAPAGDGPS